MMQENKLVDLSFVKSDILNRETAINLYNQCGTIRRILIASINTAKENAK